MSDAELVVHHLWESPAGGHFGLGILVYQDGERLPVLMRGIPQ